MSKWKDSDAWSTWVCAHAGCQAEQSDPDTVSITSCGKGHTNYLGPIEGNIRRAYTSANERARDIQEHRTLVKMMSDAVRAGRAQIAKSGRKPRL